MVYTLSFKNIACQIYYFFKEEGRKRTQPCCPRVLILSTHLGWSELSHSLSDRLISIWGDQFIKFQKQFAELELGSFYVLQNINLHFC